MSINWSLVSKAVLEVHLNKVKSKRFQLIFWLSAKDIELNLSLNMYLSMDQSWVVLWKKNLSIHSFWVKNAKINVFEEKQFSIDSFYQTEVQRGLQNDQDIWKFIRAIENLLTADV